MNIGDEMRLNTPVYSVCSVAIFQFGSANTVTNHAA